MAGFRQSLKIVGQACGNSTYIHVREKSNDTSPTRPSSPDKKLKGNSESSILDWLQYGSKPKDQSWLEYVKKQLPASIPKMLFKTGINASPEADPPPDKVKSKSAKPEIIGRNSALESSEVVDVTSKIKTDSEEANPGSSRKSRITSIQTKDNHLKMKGELQGPSQTQPSVRKSTLQSAEIDTVPSDIKPDPNEYKSTLLGTISTLESAKLDAQPRIKQNNKESASVETALKMPKIEISKIVDVNSKIETKSKKTNASLSLDSVDVQLKTNSDTKYSTRDQSDLKTSTVHSTNTVEMPLKINSESKTTTPIELMSTIPDISTEESNRVKGTKKSTKKLEKEVQTNTLQNKLENEKQTKSKQNELYQDYKPKSVKQKSIKHSKGSEMEKKLSIINPEHKKLEIESENVPIQRKLKKNDHTTLPQQEIESENQVRSSQKHSKTEARIKSLQEKLKEEDKLETESKPKILSKKFISKVQSKSLQSEKEQETSNKLMKKKLETTNMIKEPDNELETPSMGTHLHDKLELNYPMSSHGEINEELNLSQESVANSSTNYAYFPPRKENSVALNTRFTSSDTARTNISGTLSVNSKASFSKKADDSEKDQGSHNQKILVSRLQRMTEKFTNDKCQPGQHTPFLKANVFNPSYNSVEPPKVPYSFKNVKIAMPAKQKWPISVTNTVENIKTAMIMKAVKSTTPKAVPFPKNNPAQYASYQRPPRNFQELKKLYNETFDPKKYTATSEQEKKRIIEEEWVTRPLKPPGNPTPFINPDSSRLKQWNQGSNREVQEVSRKIRNVLINDPHLISPYFKEPVSLEGDTARMVVRRGRTWDNQNLR